MDLARTYGDPDFGKLPARFSDNWEQLSDKRQPVRIRGRDRLVWPSYPYIRHSSAQLAFDDTGAMSDIRIDRGRSD